MAVTTFNVDPKLDQTLEALKTHYHASSKAEILRKAVALLNVASRSEQEDGSVIIRQDGQDVKIILR
ncbi:hypothetical protein [Thiomonas sp. FB-Cd]|uniref:hypothetical protein n=1 Tax=Thiomonas sp. FB-Cd TaxID=1158292 RepID=UPI0004DEFA8B|nr:hypothetical protein [Thiomonas sp. FB-Cd]